VVGYDGSPSSLAAVTEAARRAGPAGRLIVVHAYEPPPEALGWPLYESAARDAASGAQQCVDRLRGHPALEEVDWTAEVVAGPTAEVIDAAARNLDADAIYIGSRGAGRASALLGSVAHAVLHLADRPVTVITERAAAA
jgi:nucleotide-binding universal stress UspA family protein